MKRLKAIETFNDRYPLVGPLFWITSLQYMLIQLYVGLAWKMPYSLANNTISDLGNTSCGQYGLRFVCSPRHSIMNASFVVLGCTMIAGSTLIYREFKQGKPAIVGFAFMALAGFGTLLVGFFPENTISALHITGAGLAFLIGNVGIGILGVKLAITKTLRIYSILTSIITLIALGFLLSSHYFGLGLGGMERLSGYPQTLWLIVFGLYMSRRHYQQRRGPIKKYS